MENNLQLLTTKNFNGIAFDCYKAENEDDGFWATREQIGMLLGYKDPVNSIMKIHTRNADRLDKFSTWVKLSQVEGERIVTREITVYSFMGFLEICRFSKQPKADAVIDFAWAVMNEIRKTGSYGTQNIELDPLNVRARVAEVLQRLALLVSDEYEKQEIIHEAFKFATGHEMPKKTEKSQLPAKYWTAEQIGKTLKWPFDAVMHRAENLGITKKNRFGYWDGDTWYFNKEGRARFLDLVRQKIVKIEDGFEFYEDGYKRLHWSFDPEAYEEHA